MYNLKHALFAGIVIGQLMACASTKEIPIRKQETSTKGVVEWSVKGAVQRIDIDEADNHALIVIETSNNLHTYLLMDMDSENVVWARSYSKTDPWIRIGPYLHRPDVTRPLMFELVSRKRLADPEFPIFDYQPDTDLFLMLKRGITGSYRIHAHHWGQPDPVWTRDIGRMPPSRITRLNERKSMIFSRSIHFVDHQTGQGSDIQFEGYASPKEIELMATESLIYSALGVGMFALTGSGSVGMFWREYQTIWNSSVFHDNHFYMLNEKELIKIDTDQGVEDYRVVFRQPLTDEARVVPQGESIYVLNRTAVLDSMTTKKTGLPRVMRYDALTGQQTLHVDFGSDHGVYSQHRIQDVRESGDSLIVDFDTHLVVLDRIHGTYLSSRSAPSSVSEWKPLAEFDGLFTNGKDLRFLHPDGMQELKGIQIGNLVATKDHILMFNGSKLFKLPLLAESP